MFSDPIMVCSAVLVRWRRKTVVGMMEKTLVISMHTGSRFEIR